jgi:type III pantothenate kinase
VELEPPASIIGRNTVEALQSGLLVGNAAMVEGMVSRIRDQLGSSQVPVIATGLMAASVARLATIEMTVDDMLTLDGLRIIFERR